MSADAVEGLRINIDELRGVLDSLSADEWQAPSACAGWRIQDVVAHMNSSAKLMTGNATPPAVDGDLPGAEDMAELVSDDVFLTVLQDTTTDDMAEQYGAEKWYFTLVDKQGIPRLIHYSLELGSEGDRLLAEIAELEAESP